MIHVGSKHVWIWICIEAVHKSVLGIHLSEEREKQVCSKKIFYSLACFRMYSKHAIYPDDWTWYSQSCNFLQLKHTLLYHCKRI